jgi:thiosulfate/3-mercaptopyruvate sulfurtransferase
MRHDDLKQRVFISAESLAVELAADSPPVVLVVKSGPPAVGQARIPGAVEVSLDRELASPGGGLAGARPLPNIKDLQKNARRWGISSDSRVVVYDDDRGFAAARGWWTLRWAGVRDVRILDGGFRAWLASDGAVADDTPPVREGNVELQVGNLPVLDADGAGALAGSGVLLDARSEKAFAEGHIPGAINASAAISQNEDGTLAHADVLHQRFWPYLEKSLNGALGVYCGSGVSAAFQLAALASIGLEPALYPGSWSAWSADTARPVERGHQANNYREISS